MIPVSGNAVCDFDPNPLYVPEREKFARKAGKRALFDRIWR
jgi:hypothetical protein